MTFMLPVVLKFIAEYINIYDIYFNCILDVHAQDNGSIVNYGSIIIK